MPPRSAPSRPRCPPGMHVSMKHLSRAWHQASEREGPCAGSPKHSYKWKEEPHRRAVLSAGMSSNSTVNTRAARGRAGAPESWGWPNCCPNPAQTQPKRSLNPTQTQPESIPSPSPTQPKLNMNPSPAQPKFNPNSSPTQPQPSPNLAQTQPKSIPIPPPTQTQPPAGTGMALRAEQSRLRTAERWEQDASCTLET